MEPDISLVDVLRRVVTLQNDGLFPESDIGWKKIDNELLRGGRKDCNATHLLAISDHI
jgi:hypothetical protein